ncbi:MULTISPECIES: hypothetical protein [unclassified Pseudovibrio]|uniref:hypothetical protein n=1 Tax=unclassified Pseudovibrio TaxID=2627060 RepID=UPI0007AE3BBA|nr:MULTISPECIES: hypothetical protein [unclassified Pseudovibrio]KZK97274.1 hypothetical protein PsW74_03714 [Pseudovibrio sp. W74]KZL08960.1 hypothetical protein PsAD14_02539 [Pseudovibrio sp. Ad14]
MSNLKLHQQLVGKILHFLYEKGLSKTDISSNQAQDFYKGTSLEGEAKFQIFSDVLDWMEREGLISMSSNNKTLSGSFHHIGVQLTSYGISLIQTQKFDALDKSTIEEEIDNSNGDISAEKYGKFGALIGGFVGGFAQSAG